MSILDTIKALGAWLRNLGSKSTSSEVSTDKQENSANNFLSMKHVNQRDVLEELENKSEVSKSSSVHDKRAVYELMNRNNSSMSLESIIDTLSAQGSNQTEMVNKIFENAIIPTDHTKQESALAAISSLYLDENSDINKLEEAINSCLDDKEKIYNPVVIAALCQTLQTISQNILEDMDIKDKLSAIIEKLQIQPVKQIFENATSTDKDTVQDVKKKEQVALNVIENLTLNNFSDINQLKKHINNYLKKNKFYNPVVIAALCNKLKMISQENTEIISDLQAQLVKQIFENAISTDKDILKVVKEKEQAALTVIENLTLNNISDINQLEKHINSYLKNDKFYNPVVIAALCQKLQNITINTQAQIEEASREKLSEIIKKLSEIYNTSTETVIIEKLRDHLQEGEKQAVSNEWMYVSENVLSADKTEPIEQYLRLCRTSIQEINLLNSTTLQRKNTNCSSKNSFT